MPTGQPLAANAFCMTRFSQKEREKKFLEGFLEIFLPPNSHYEIIDSKSEPPDFFINVQGQTIEVELTEIVSDEIHERRDSLENDITKFCLSIFNQKFKYPISSYISFKNDYGNILRNGI